MHHQAREVEAAIRPTPHEVAVAQEQILGLLGKGEASAAALFAAVARRFEKEEPRPSASGIEGVTSDALLQGKATGATALGLAHLEATGSVLPYGPRRTHDWQSVAVPYSHGNTTATYQLDPFNFELADVYVLPMTGFAPEVETPVMFVDHLPKSMGTKVRRVLLEAINAYRGGLFVAAAILIGTASEAAWEQLAAAVAKKSGDAKLTSLLADPFEGISKIQARTLEVLASLKVKSPSELAALDASATTYRELRNHAVHEPEASFDDALFARAPIGTLAAGSVFYFGRLYELLEVVTR